MAQSPAKAHLANFHARQAAILVGSIASALIAAPPPEDGPEAAAYQMLLAQLYNDQTQLSDIASRERKIEAKRELVKNYDDHIAAVLTAAHTTEKAVNDQVFTTLMIWHIDIGNMELALDMADHVLKFGLTLPEKYKRNVQTLVTEEISLAAINDATAGKDFDIEILRRLQEMMAPYDMADQLRAKLHKAMGLHLVRHSEFLETADSAPAGGVASARAEALNEFKRAFELDANIGVKKDIERLESRLRSSSKES